MLPTSNAKARAEVLADLEEQLRSHRKPVVVRVQIANGGQLEGLAQSASVQSLAVQVPSQPQPIVVPASDIASLHLAVPRWFGAPRWELWFRASDV